MDVELLRSHWALAAAAAVLVLLGVVRLVHKLSGSSLARLRRARRAAAQARRRLARAERAVARAEASRRRLETHRNAVKPRLIDEAQGALEDARALARVAHDQVLIAETHLRRIILEEFAPAKQARLREKYLPEAPADRRPFSF